MQQSDECGSVDLMFRAFSDRTRLRILCLIRKRELCVGDIVDILQVPQPRISRHLAYLRKAGLVIVRKAGLWSYYGLASARTRSIGSCLRAWETVWRKSRRFEPIRLGRLRLREREDVVQVCRLDLNLLARPPERTTWPTNSALKGLSRRGGCQRRVVRDRSSLCQEISPRFPARKIRAPAPPVADCLQENPANGSQGYMRLDEYLLYTCFRIHGRSFPHGERTFSVSRVPGDKSC